MKMRILLAVDGSSFSDAATAEVARRAWPVGSEVKVLSIFEPAVAPTPEAWTIPPDYFEEMNNASRTNASSLVEAAIAKLKQTLPASSKITGQFVQNFPKSVILDEAERWGADLIVVGSHGYRAWERFLLGSVSQAVVAHAKCSVEVVRNRNGTM
jgi:nucleotide-binding universal stress UspA family protein